MPADAGIKFGQYVLLRRIARGGMAEVFLAQQRGLEGFDRRVAVKRILPHLADSPDFVKMFLGEAKLAAQLSHPNIVHIYEFGKVDHDYFIAMEFVDGVHAGQLFKHGEKELLPATMVARIGADAANALHYAHDLRASTGKPYGLVHRDVSPANIMVSFDGVVKLCDFGIAKAAALSDQLTNPGQVKGKYAYMSPEQTIASPLDGRSDVFSLAIVLWELLVGRYLVQRGDAIEGMRSLRDGKIEPIERAAPNVPAPLAKAITWALEPKRDARATAGELAQALEAFIKQAPELATSMQLASWVRGRFERERTNELPALVPPPGGGTMVSPGTVASPGTVIGAATQGPVTPPRVITAAQLLSDSYDASDLDETAETLKVGKYGSGAATMIDPRSRRASEEATLRDKTEIVTPTPPPAMATSVSAPRSAPRVGPIPPADTASRRRNTPLPAEVAGRRRLKVAIAFAGLVALAFTSFLIALAASSSRKPAARDAAPPRPDAATLAVTPFDAEPVDATSEPDAAPPSMLVEIDTNPHGATIKLAGQTMFSPTKLALQAGHYELTAELAGYEPEHREFDLEVGDHPIFEIAFAHKLRPRVERGPGIGTLTVRTTPYAEVFEGGKRIGETPFADREMTAGVHTLTFKHPQHALVTRKITIVAGKPTKLNFSLP